ncbi:MAG: hypothetical protein GC190_02995 [Alphaproteobacteria bacterium]|nr:hypothetical protein [Alphaproteobacteria bacterium]
MTAATAIPVTTTPASTALTGGIASAKASPAAAALTAGTAGAGTSQATGEGFAAALAALLGVATQAQPQASSHAPKSQPTTTQQSSATDKKDQTAVVVPVVPGLVLQPALPQQQAQQEALTVQAATPAAQTQAANVLLAAPKGSALTVETKAQGKGAASPQPVAGTTAAQQSIPETSLAIVPPAQAAAAQHASTPTPVAQVVAQAAETPAQPDAAQKPEANPVPQTAAASLGAAAVATLLANPQQTQSSTPASAKTPSKPETSKDVPALAKLDSTGQANPTPPTTDGKLAANTHLADAIQHALSNNGNGGAHTGDGGANGNTTTPQLPSTASPVAVAVHTSTVDTTAPVQAPLPQQPVAVPLDTLAVHIARKFESGESRFEIRLDPVELGKLDISMTVADDGRLQAVVRAERPETLDMLQRDARVLENQLRSSGFNVDSGSLNFSLGGGSNQQSAFAEPKFGGTFTTTPEAEQIAATTTVVNVRDGLDIRI